MNETDSKKAEQVEKSDTKTQKSKEFVLNWKSIFVGATIGAVIGAMVGIFLLFSLKSNMNNMEKKLKTAEQELAKYKPMVDESVLPKARLFEFSARMKQAFEDGITAKQQDLIIYYHPWESDPQEYYKFWVTSYMQLRSSLFQEVESLKFSHPELYIRQLIRLGIWSEILGKDKDASDTYQIAIEDSKEISEKSNREMFMKRLNENGILDCAYRGLGYAKRYEIPNYIDDIENKDIYDILIQFDGEWVMSEKLKELKTYEAKVKPKDE